ncbi:MAG TPA: CBS domain-containing protein [Bryobacteraceae bacterium]|nr:CBS domain-containing protein [Bryobacteraceae bacterium]
MADQLLFFTELVGLKVYDLKGRKLGMVRDAAVVPLVDPVRIDRFLIGGDGTLLTVRYDQVRSISLDGIYLRDENLTPYHSDEYMLRLKRDLLDQQIIDAQGHKVVRVNDVTFEFRGENGGQILWILEVDIGIRSMFRRVMQGILPPGWVRHLQEGIPPHSIRWEFCNILEPDPQRRLRLNISNRLLEDMHPADLADIVEELGPEDREAIFENIDSEVAAEALTEVDPDIQASILESLETETAADIIEEMAPDHAADALAELEEETSDEILEEMEGEPKQDVEELLEFDEDTAGGLMNTEYLALGEKATVADALEALKANESLVESVNSLYLVDAEERLKAAVPLARLFLHEAATPLMSLAAETLIQAHVDEPQDRITELFDKYNLLTMPVVDESGRLAGVVTADDIISVLRQK